MTTGTTSAFALPHQLAAKADPALIADDERHLATIAASLEHSIADLSERINIALKAPGGTDHAAMERDEEIHRLSTRIRTLRRYSLDLCLGRVVSAEGDSLYIGRLGLTDSAGARLLIDWRSPAAEPFFGATHANPMGLASRRRFRWTRGRITDYWDEVFTPEGLERLVALTWDDVNIADDPATIRLGGAADIELHPPLDEPFRQLASEPHNHQTPPTPTAIGSSLATPPAGTSTPATSQVACAPRSVHGPHAWAHSTNSPSSLPPPSSPKSSATPPPRSRSMPSDRPRTTPPTSKLD